MAQYRTLSDLPGIPAGEVLQLDTSRPGHTCYRGVTHTSLWFSQAVVENDATAFQNTAAPVYFYLDSSGAIQQGVDIGTAIDSSRKAYGNYFASSALAATAKNRVSSALSNVVLAPI